MSTLIIGILNNKGPDNVAFHQYPHCLLRQKMVFRENNAVLFGNYNLEIINYGPYHRHTMDMHPTLIVSNQKEESISI